MDDKSRMMKYQTGSHDDIISLMLNGRGKSVRRFKPRCGQKYTLQARIK